MKVLNTLYLKSILASMALFSTLHAGAQISEIRNGNPVQSKQFEGVVSLFYLDKSSTTGFYESQYKCSASLVSPTRVMTATHCIASPYTGEVYTKPIYVVIAKNFANPDTVFKKNNFRSFAEMAKEGLIVRKVNSSNFIFHPTFVPNESRFSQNFIDFSFLKLNKAIRSVKPLVLANRATANKIRQSSKIKVLGYGVTHYTEDGTPILAETLQHVNLNFYPLQACKNLSIMSIVQDNNMCVRETEPDAAKRKGTCRGDSGAPWMIFNAKESRYEIVGVHSFGLGERGNCFAGEVAVAERITAFPAWVDSVAETGYSIK